MNLYLINFLFLCQIDLLNINTYKLLFYPYFYRSVAFNDHIINEIHYSFIIIGFGCRITYVTTKMKAYKFKIKGRPY
jgi:hypothetical protein